MSKEAQDLLEIIVKEMGEMDAAKKKRLLEVIEHHFSKIEGTIRKKVDFRSEKRFKNLERSLRKKYQKKKDEPRTKIQLIPKHEVVRMKESIREELDREYRSKLEESREIKEKLLDEIVFLTKQIARMIEKADNADTELPSDIVEDEDLPMLVPIEHMELYIEAGAFRKMMGHCARLGNNNLEAMGFLMGDEYTFEGYRHTVVEDVVTSELDSSAVSVKISDFSPMFEEMHNMEKAGKNYILVGWYHSHPGHTCFLSAMDISTQRRMFKEDYHVAVVVDPINLELKSFKLDLEKQYREMSFAVYRET